PQPVHPPRFFFWGSPDRAPTFIDADLVRLRRSRLLTWSYFPIAHHLEPSASKYGATRGKTGSALGR
ncbi:MAG: hypothetical protein WAM98_20545, partial [Terriglobales bacterium]